MRPMTITSAVLAGASYIFRDNYHDDESLIDRWLTNYTVVIKQSYTAQTGAYCATGCDTSAVEMRLPHLPPKCFTTRERKKLGFQLVHLPLNLLAHRLFRRCG